MLQPISRTLPVLLQATSWSLVLCLVTSLSAGASSTPNSFSGSYTEAADCLSAQARKRAFTTGTYLDEEITLRRRGVTLKGHLYRPNRPGPHPGVLLLPGGGNSSRPYFTARYVAAQLARCGVAVLFYDKRGTGRSAGTWEESSYDDYVRDAVHALYVLADQPAIDGERLGIVGLSQGGRLAPVVATRMPQVRFVAAVAAPFVSVRETRLYALAQHPTIQRLRPDLRQHVLSLWHMFFDRLETQRSTADLDPYIKNLSLDLPGRLLPPLSYANPGSPLFNSLSLDYTAALRDLDIPLLALFAGADELVPTAASQAALTATLPPTVDLTLRTIPDVSHSFTYADPARSRFRFEDLVTAWVLHHTGLADGCGASYDSIPDTPEASAAISCAE